MKKIKLLFGQHEDVASILVSLYAAGVSGDRDAWSKLLKGLESGNVASIFEASKAFASLPKDRSHSIQESELSQVKVDIFSNDPTSFIVSFGKEIGVAFSTNKAVIVLRFSKALVRFGVQIDFDVDEMYSAFLVLSRMVEYGGPKRDIVPLLVDVIQEWNLFLLSLEQIGESRKLMTKSDCVFTFADPNAEPSNEIKVLKRKPKIGEPV